MPNIDPNIPAYELLSQAFYEPHLLERGSIIQTMAPPGPHLKPLNAKAREAFEEWYQDEAIALNERGEKTDRLVKHHEKYRMKEYSPAEKQTAVLIEGPAADLPGALSLAEAMTGSRTPTDQRPPPLKARQSAIEIAIQEAEQGGEEEESAASVLLSAPPPTARERKGL